MIDKIKYPGKHELNDFNDVKLFKQIYEFIDENGNEKLEFADVGENSLKLDYITRKLKLSQYWKILAFDFNFQILMSMVKYDIILCFEILEHLQNPLYFMDQLKKLLADNGTIYLSMPARPRILWTEHHYNEIPPKHFEKWILKPLGLKIIKMKKLRPTHHWSFYFKGFRPFLRLFFNYTIIYKIKYE